MSTSLPPIPLYDIKDLPYTFQEWLRKLQLIVGTTGGITWSSIDFTGSDLGDLATRTHNSLQSLQGGTTNEYYHLTSAQYSKLTSGTYTPTLTNTTNIASSSASACQYLRVGDVVTVSGTVSVDPTAAGKTLLELSLPVSSNFANIEELGGVAASNLIAGLSAGMYAEVTNNRAVMEWIAVSTANNPMYFTFTYRVI